MSDYPKLGGWVQGMNTLLHKQELPADTLRSAVNIDITDKGMIKRRRGSVKKVSGVIPRGTLWSGAGRTLFVESGHLRELHRMPDGDFVSTLVRESVGNEPMAYLALNGQILWTNGVFTGRLDAKGGDHPWGVKGPDRQPNIATGTSGNLYQGTYQIAVTFVGPDGEESGTPLAREVVAAENGSSIVLNNIPQPYGATDKIRVYCSHVNGEGLYWVGDIYQGVPLFEIDDVSNFATVLLQTQFGVSPPAGTALEAHNGRVFIVRDNIVWITEPMRYGLVKPLKDFFQFPSAVTIIKAVSDGIYIVADKTYWISGIDTPQLEQTEVLPYGGVYGTGIDIPQFDAVAWFSHKGLVIGGLNGEVYNTMEDRVAVSEYGSGAMFWREDRGIRSVVATLHHADITPFMIPDYVALETARSGAFA